MTEPPEGYLGAGGPIRSGPAPELVEAGYELELADAPLLARGFGLADLAHAIALDAIPAGDRRALVGALVGLLDEEIEIDSRYGDLANVRERELEERIGSAAGWLNAGRPRREAGRIAFRIALRSRVLDLAAAVTRFGAALTEVAARERDTLAARLHLPAGGAADHGRPLAAVVRPSRAARPRAPARRLRVGQPQSRRHRRGERLALRRSTASGSPSCSASAGRSSTRATPTGRPTASPT